MNGGIPGRGKGSTAATDELLEAIAGLVTEGFEEVEVTARNASDQPTTVLYRETPAGLTVATLTITYDVSGNFEKVTKT
jgi:hypothetical protein